MARRKPPLPAKSATPPRVRRSGVRAADAADAADAGRKLPAHIEEDDTENPPSSPITFAWHTLPSGQKIRVTVMREYPDTFDAERHEKAKLEHAARPRGPFLPHFAAPDDADPCVLIAHGTYADPDLITRVAFCAAPPWAPERLTLAYWRGLLPQVAISLKHYPGGLGAPAVAVGSWRAGEGLAAGEVAPAPVQVVLKVAGALLVVGHTGWSDGLPAYELNPGQISFLRGEL